MVAEGEETIGDEDDGGGGSGRSECWLARAAGYGSQVRAYARIVETCDLNY